MSHARSKVRSSISSRLGPGHFGCDGPLCCVPRILLIARQIARASCLPPLVWTTSAIRSNALCGSRSEHIRAPLASHPLSPLPASGAEQSRIAEIGLTLMAGISATLLPFDSIVLDVRYFSVFRLGHWIPAQWLFRFY